MPRFPRVVILLVAVIVAVTVAASAAIAFPDRATFQGKGNFKGHSFAKLKDIKGHWAEQDVLEIAAQGIIRGYPDLTFQPNKPVTHAEAIVMLANTLGLEKETPRAARQQLAARLRYRVPAWAESAVAAAVYAGILTEADLAQFRPNQPAKRYEIAVYLVRALKIRLEEQSQVELQFVDEDAIPVWARVYVGLANRERLMLGEHVGQAGFRFQPQRPVKRAEMAALLLRIQEYLQDKLSEIVKEMRLVGTVTAVGEGTLTVKKADGTTVTVAVYEDTLIYLGRERIALEDIDIGATVRVIVADGKALFIRVCPDEACEPVREQDREREQERDRTGQPGREDKEEVEENYEEVTGTITAIVTVDGKTTLKVLSGNRVLDLEVAADAGVEVHNRPATVADLRTGQKVHLEVKNGVVTEIEVVGNGNARGKKD
ncbi:MAG: S-layer homology domain-containing protein [Bacillota bacterium]